MGMKVFGDTSSWCVQLNGDDDTSFLFSRGQKGPRMQWTVYVIAGQLESQFESVTVALFASVLVFSMLKSSQAQIDRHRP